MGVLEKWSIASNRKAANTVLKKGSLLFSGKQKSKLVFNIHLGS